MYVFDVANINAAWRKISYFCSTREGQKLYTVPFHGKAFTVDLCLGLHMKLAFTYSFHKCIRVYLMHNSEERATFLGRLNLSLPKEFNEPT